VKKQENKRRRQSTAEWAAEQYEESFFLPVVFHNLKSYDAHFVIRHFQKKYTERQPPRDNDCDEDDDDNDAGDKNTDNDHDNHYRDNVTYDDISVIPLNGQKYLQFQIGELRFLDSYQFLSTSLDQLVSLLLKSGKHNFEHTKKHLGTDDDLIFAKGVFPYSYMSCREKFEETELPPIECFHDTLKDEPLKEEDYERAKQTWTRFNITNMREYHDHYLLTDVLLLVDVLEHFRQTVIKGHKLDCLHYITLPSLAWSMALKHTDVELDLITDPDMYLLVENNLRGGIATISKRYAAANNPCVEGYDATQPHTYLSYLDANSLYATAQSEPLPVGEFKFLTEEEVRDFDLDSVAPDAKVGYIIECDLEYPASIHDLHNDYPMAPEHLTVTKEMLSPFAANLLECRPSPSRDRSGRPWTPTQKLVPNLFDKSKYVSHYRNLQLYTKHGLKITKIHRILSFVQSPWLKSWIDLCNQQRRAATSEFHSDLAKLQANATFGKTMEQVRHRVNIRLIADPNRLTKAVSKVTFRQSEIINQDLVMVRSARTKIKLNKPIAVGFCILELSKVIMYTFFYEHLKAKYAERCTLLFTDTDSLCCQITTRDLYDDMGQMMDQLDTSNFPIDHPQYSQKNRRVLGKFKSETGSMAPKEFVGLRAKMYSLWVPGDATKCHKKAKGIQKHYVKTRVRHQQFLDVLRNSKQTTTAKFRGFRSTKHVINTVEMKKLCLCAFDDKRYVLEDGIRTLAYGHYSLRK